MTSPDLSFISEMPAHDAQIEHLNEIAFGPGRFSRAAHLIREGGPHDYQCSFVVMKDDTLIGSVRMTRIRIGAVAAYLLGPIVIEDHYKNSGIGGQLMKLALEAAQKTDAALVLLVGDEPYYRRFGFSPVAYQSMQMPAPVNPNRLLALELKKGGLKEACGVVLHEKRWRGL